MALHCIAIYLCTLCLVLLSLLVSTDWLKANGLQIMDCGDLEPSETTTFWMVSLSSKPLCCA